MPDEEDELALGGDDHETEETGLGGGIHHEDGGEDEEELAVEEVGDAHEDASCDSEAD